METKINYFEKQFTYQKRNVFGRLLYFISAEVGYYKDEPLGKCNVSEIDYDMRYVTFQFSFPELLFFRKYALKEYIQELEFSFCADVIDKKQPFNPKVLEDLGKIIDSFHGIEKFYLPNFILTSLDRSSEIDIDKMYEIIGGDSDLPWIDLAIHSLQLNHLIDVEQNDFSIPELLSKIQDKKAKIHPWVYFIITEMFNLDKIH